MRAGKSHMVRIREEIYDVLVRERDAAGVSTPMNTYIEEVLTRKLPPEIQVQAPVAGNAGAAVASGADLKRLLSLLAEGEVYVKVSFEVVGKKDALKLLRLVRVK